MVRALVLFIYFAVSAFALTSIIYWMLHSVMPDRHVFGGLYRMFLYHDSHPFQYIAVYSLTYAIVATVVCLIWPKLVGWRRNVAIMSIIIFTVFAASIPGGILWKIHDMQAGYFPEGLRFWDDLLWGASSGLAIGWLIVLLLLPYNIICLVLLYYVTHYGFNIRSPKAQPGAAPDT